MSLIKVGTANAQKWEWFRNDHKLTIYNRNPRSRHSWRLSNSCKTLIGLHEMHGLATILLAHDPFIISLPYDHSRHSLGRYLLINNWLLGNSQPKVLLDDVSHSTCSLSIYILIALLTLYTCRLHVDRRCIVVVCTLVQGIDNKE